MTNENDDPIRTLIELVRESRRAGWYEDYPDWDRVVDLLDPAQRQLDSLINGIEPCLRCEALQHAAEEKLAQALLRIEELESSR